MIPSDRKPEIYILTDSLPSSGLGHARRTISLGQALRTQGCEVAYWLLSESRTDIFEAAGFSPTVLHDPADTRFLGQLLSQAQDPLLIVDTYLLAQDFYDKLVNSLPVVPIFAFDDYGEKIGLPLLGVINPGLGADQIPYPGRLKPFSAIGPEYMPLPEECLQARLQKNISNQGGQVLPQNILLVMGASDPERQTERLTRILLAMSESFILHVVAGPHYGPHDALKILCASDQRAILHIAPKDFHRLAASCDLAIVSAGLTVAELLHLGVPVAALALADNQEPTANALEQSNFGVNLGRFDQKDDHELSRDISRAMTMPERMGEMAAKGRELFDGQGASRLSAHVLTAWERYQGRHSSTKAVVSAYRQAFGHPEPYRKVLWGSAQGMENRYALALQILGSVQGETWLDVGSGTGEFFLHAVRNNQMPRTYRGVDVTEELTNYAVERCSKLTDIEHMFACQDFMQPVPEEPFTLVTCLGVLQNCGAGLDRAVARLGELVALGGRVLVSTKNLDWQAFDEPGCIPCPDHHWYRIAQLREAFAKAGLEDIWITGYEPRSGRLLPERKAHSVFVSAGRGRND
jgi:UDP-2,4-diacetamido-2,4,6-trideoxy-beta-L-altropyranose hydrolase